MADKTPVPPPTVPEAGPIGVFCPCCNDLRGSLPTQWILCDICFVAFKEGDQTVLAQSQSVPHVPSSAVLTTVPSEDPLVCPPAVSTSMLEDDPYDFISQVVCSLD